MARFTVSIDDGLKEQLDGFAEAQGYNRSEALEVMIRAFFEVQVTAREPAESSEDKSPAAAMEKSTAPTNKPDVGPKDEDWRDEIARLEDYLVRQQAYLKDLHSVVDANKEVCSEAFSSLGLSYDFYVTSVEPPELDGREGGQ